MTFRFCFLSCGSLLLTFAAGCGLAYDYDPPADTGPGADVPRDAAAVDAPRPDAALDAPALPDVPLDAAFVDVPSIDTPPDARTTECIIDADCARMAMTPCPAGTWSCFSGVCGVLCPDCTDADHDGHGVGMGCAGPDCDDADPLVLSTDTQACYPGPGGTSGVGVCADGERICAAGVWSTCLGAVTPSAESCNGLDDDCNSVPDDGLGTISCGLGTCATRLNICDPSGALATCPPPSPASSDACGGGDQDCDGVVDENCGPCVYVHSTTGVDASANPTVVATPMRTVQAALNYAADPRNMAPQRVCLLTTTCGTILNFPGDVTMRAGISVIGNWGPAGVSQCGSLSTQISPPSAEGVRFDGGSTGATLADVIVRPASGSRAVGVTVTSTAGAVLSGVQVNPSSGTSVVEGYGVNVESDGDVLITRSSITASNASGEAIGVRVVGARATLLNNCPVPLDAAGRCPNHCMFGVTGNSIRGRVDTALAAPSVGYAILLRDAAGSMVLSTATCGQKGTSAAGIHVDGDSDGIVISGDFIEGWGGTNESFGIDLADCGDASPWIVGNVEINGESGVGAPNGAIRSRGACHPVIEGNLFLRGGIEGRGLAHGVICGALPGGSTSSRCVITDNPRIEASSGGFPTTAIGVSCEADGCALVARNAISGISGVDVVGLALGTAATRVERNIIVGGCPTVSATGVRAIDSAARLENNLISASLGCSATGAGGLRFVALDARASSPTRMLDVRSNDLFGGGGAGLIGCQSRGIELRGTGAPVGLFRGNIIGTGLCANALGVLETDRGSDPWAFLSNDVVRISSPLYRDENTTDLLSAAAIDLLTDVPVMDNIDGPPGFVSATDFHLSFSSSPCVDADFASGAPAVDFDGRPRGAAPDIGAFEF